MPTAFLDGIETQYEVIGAGPPLLMFSPGGFNAVADNWRSLGIYRGIQPLENLSSQYSCIAFDRREAGGSGGRLERVTWDDYVRQGVALLDHLGLEDAHVMGGCVGCSQAAALAVAHPARVRSMVLYSPAGGPRYRMTNHARFGEHLAYVSQHGLESVVDLANEVTAGFSKDPRVGPWVSVIRQHQAFAASYAAADPARYLTMVTGMVRGLFDRDTVPGVEPEDLLLLDTPTLIVPGQDASHATSAARYLEECLSNSEYWDVPVADQLAGPTSDRLLTFLGQVETAH